MFDRKKIWYDLPPDAVAKTYSEERSKVKLMVVDRKTGKFIHEPFSEILNYIGNDTCYANNALFDGTPCHGNDVYPLYATERGTTVSPSSGVPFEMWMLLKLRPKFITLSTPRFRFNVDEMYELNRSIPESYFIEEPPAEPITAIGTTTVKAIESCALFKKECWISDLLITPGFEFKRTKRLLTNFHYPEEPLLALTCAFGSISLIMEAYQEAMKKGYKISDCGDRMLIL
jgi:S-adenosylmethionine:tRNA-ribosyltransferase-isomerase (queuine synthetase)